MESAMDRAQDALNRMRRAHERGTGVRLPAHLLDALSVTIVGEMWNQPDPRKEAQR